jgi:hypothetical protein
VVTLGKSVADNRDVLTLVIYHKYDNVGGVYLYPICIIIPAMSFVGAGIGRILHIPSYDL